MDWWPEETLGPASRTICDGSVYSEPPRGLGKYNPLIRRAESGSLSRYDLEWGTGNPHKVWGAVRKHGFLDSMDRPKADSIKVLVDQVDKYGG